MTLFDWEQTTWDQKYLAPEMLISNYSYDLISDEKAPGINTFPLFSKRFCRELTEQLSTFDNWTQKRHSAYPTNDILLKDYKK